jgi:GFO/IDH/MocA oxidoreductase family protein
LIESEHAAGGPDMVREPEDSSMRHWRFRESSMGKASVLGEVGSHPHNLSEYVSGLRLTSVSATLTTLAERREVYDNAYLTVEYKCGVIGRIWSSYVAAGSEHGLGLRIFGEEGSLHWRQEDPEYLWLRRPGEPAQRISRGMPCGGPNRLRRSDPEDQRRQDRQEGVARTHMTTSPPSATRLDCYFPGLSNRLGSGYQSHCLTVDFECREPRLCQISVRCAVQPSDTALMTRFRSQYSWQFRSQSGTRRIDARSQCTWHLHMRTGSLVLASTANNPRANPTHH